MPDMSMLPPQLAAIVLFWVIICVYCHIAAMLELFAAMAGIMLANDMLLPIAAVGGLMIPNIPFGQWPGVLQ